MDEFFPKDARASAQGLFNFLILGLGPFIGNNVWPQLEGYFKVGETVAADGTVIPIIDYQKLFLVPSATSLVAVALLLFCFWPPEKRVEEEISEEPVAGP